MDFTGQVQDFFSKTPLVYYAVGLTLIIIVYFLSRLFITTPLFNPNTMPATAEGFMGTVYGAGEPPCLRNLNKAAQVLEALDSVGAVRVVPSGSEEEADRKELALLLGKLACLKQDLMSPSGLVLATRSLPFETQHDRQSVAEVAGQCLSRTIPNRDLDIIFETWANRGKELIAKLCTAKGMSEEACRQVEITFSNAWKDVYGVALQRCLTTPDDGSGLKDRTAAFLPPSLDLLHTYQGYY